MCFIYRDVQYIIPFGAIIILFNLVQFLFYALRRHYYFMRFSAILRTLVRFLFYALRRDYYFMRVSAILCRGNFRHWQASTPIGVVLK